MDNDTGRDGDGTWGTTGSPKKPFSLYRAILAAAALATIIGAVVAVATLFRGEGSQSVLASDNLVAEIDATSIVLPYDHIKLIMGFVRGAYDHAIKEHLEDTEFITKLDDALAYSFNNRLDRMRNSATNDVLQIEQIHLSRLRQLNALYKVKITNKGNVPLNGVFLRFPDTSLISEQIGHAKREGGGEIAIGILKQRAEVSFFIWGDAIYSVTTTPVQEVVVGHNDGIGKVIITRRY